jgi:hypothetical protein
MRATLGAGLLLVSTTLVSVAATPAEAAIACEDPDTIAWVGPATEGGSASWDEPTNWSGGEVPDATSVVCIPFTGAGPHVPEGTRAEAGTVTLEGTLSVAGSLDVATLEGDSGELHGPGTTTVTGRLSGDRLTFRDAAVVDLPQGVTTALGGEILVYDGSRLNASGDVVLEPSARVEASSTSFDQDPGLFTINDTGSLTYDAPGSFAQVVGGFANHGDVIDAAGDLMLLGDLPARPGLFSTGSFTGAPGTEFTLAHVVLHDSARLERVASVDDISVPDGHTATVAASGLYDTSDAGEPPSIRGEGELVLLEGTWADARVGESLTVTVPRDQAVELAGTVEDEAKVIVEAGAEVSEGPSLAVLDNARIDVSGTYRVTQTAGFLPQDELGTLQIRPGAILLKEGPRVGQPFAEVVNEGTVRVLEGGLALQLADVTDPSTGSFDVAEESSLFLVGVRELHPTMALGAGATLRGSVFAVASVVADGVTFDAADVSTYLEFPGGSLTGSLHLTGTTTLRNGTRLHGPGQIAVDGSLVSDPGADGSVTIGEAEVTGSVRVLSGTLEIPTLAQTTLLPDGTLAGGVWSVAPGATLGLPAITTNDTDLTLEGPGASIGGLTALDNGPNGTVALEGGVDLALPGRFRNEGLVRLSPGSRLITGANFRQFSTGRLVTEVDATGLGRVRVEGRRDLAGDLKVQRDLAYTPPVDTVLTLLTSNGRVDPDDGFDRVFSSSFDSRRFRVVYERDYVRLRMVRIG